MPQVINHLVALFVCRCVCMYWSWVNWEIGEQREIENNWSIYRLFFYLHTQIEGYKAIALFHGNHTMNRPKIEAQFDYYR